MADLQTRSLARRLAALERAHLRSKQPNLGFSTIEGGAIQVTDEDNVLAMVMGQQVDGTIGMLFNIAGRAILGLDFGSFLDTTDANSAISIPHGCDGIPATVIAIGSTNGVNNRIRVSDATTSTFELRFRNSETNVDVGSGVTVSGYWVALR